MTSYQRVALVVGQGYDRPQGDMESPLDVNYSKINEWMLERKLLPAAWVRKLNAIHAEMARVAPALEESERCYPLAAARLEELAVTAEKTFLGGFKGEAGSWQKIVKAYERDALHVAEAAQRLARAGEYEIPALVRQVARYQQQMQEAERRTAAAHRSAAAARAEYGKTCTAKGIKPAATNLRAAVQELVQTLPAALLRAVETLRVPELARAAEHLAAFADLARDARTGAGDEAAQQSQWQDLLPALAEVMEGSTPALGPGEGIGPGSGDAGEAEGRGDEESLDLDAVLAGLGGDATDATASTNDVVWDFDVADVEASGTEAEAELPASSAAGLEDVAWDVDVEAAGDEQDGSGGYGGTVSAGGDAGTRDAAASSSTRRGFYAEDCTLERLGEDGSYRALLLDNLFELAAFLEQRQAETAALGDLSLAVLQAGGRAAEVGTEGLASMLRAARGALDAWRGEELRRLLQLRTSPAAVERFARELEQARGHEAKWKQAASDATKRRLELQRALVSDAGALEELKTAARETKVFVEGALSTRLKRPVHVTGGINSALL